MATNHRGKYHKKVLVATHENRCNHQSMELSQDENQRSNDKHQTCDKNRQAKGIHVPLDKNKNRPLKSNDDSEDHCSHCKDTTQPLCNCCHISQVNGKSQQKNTNKSPKTLFHQALNKCFASKEKKCQHKNKCQQPPRLTQSTRHSCKPVVRDHGSQRTGSQHEVLCNPSGDKCQVTCPSQKHQPTLPLLDKPGRKRMSSNQSHQPSDNHQPTKLPSPRMCSTPKKQKHSSSLIYAIKVHSGTNEQFLKVIKNSENASTIVRRKFKRRFASNGFVPKLKPIEEHEEKEATTEVDEDNINTKEVHPDDMNTEDKNIEDVHTEEIGTELGTEDVNNKIVNSQHINTHDVVTEDTNTENVYTLDVNAEDIKNENVSASTENVSTGTENEEGSHRFDIKRFFRTLVVWCAQLFTCFLPHTRTKKKTN